jgi:hypothetical protein
MRFLISRRNLMATQNRQRTSDEIAKIITKQRASGLSQQNFCKAERIPLSTFQNWSRKARGTAAFSELSLPTRISGTTVEITFSDGTTLKIRGE